MVSSFVAIIEKITAFDFWLLLPLVTKQQRQISRNTSKLRYLLNHTKQEVAFELKIAETICFSDKRTFLIQTRKSY